MVDLSFVVGLIGNVISILVFTSPISTFRRVVKKKSIENFKGLPYVTTLLSTTLWSYYGLLKPGGLLVVTVNGVGSVLQTVYVILFIIYAPKETRVWMLKLVGVLNVGFSGMVILVTFFALHGITRLLVIGFLCAALTVGMYAAPMASMRLVVKTRSVEYMPFSLSFFLFLNGGVWSVYSLLVKDFFIGVPNAIGFVLGSAQLILYAIYKKKIPLSKLVDLEMAEEEGSAILVAQLEMQGSDKSTQHRNLTKIPYMICFEITSNSNPTHFMSHWWVVSINTTNQTVQITGAPLVLPRFLALPPQKLPITLRRPPLSHCQFSPSLPTMVELSFIVGLLGNVISILVFTSPIATFRRVVKKKSTENFKGLPYVTTLLSTTLWSYYGLLKPGGLLILTVNGVGSVLQTVYVILFIIYAPKGTRVWMLKLVGVLNVGFSGLVIVVTFFALHGITRLLVIGFLCAALTVGMYAAPMASMRLVVKTRSVEYMPFSLSFFLFLNGGVWSVYSLLVKDFFIGVPNAIGFVLGSAQLILYAVYRKKTPISKLIDLEMAEEEGSAILVSQLEMQGTDKSTQNRNLTKVSSLPKPSVSREHSLTKIVKALSLTPFELHSFLNQNAHIGD